MEVDLRLVFGPLAGRAYQEHYLGLDCFNVDAFFRRRCVIVAPDIQEDARMVVPPRVSVIAAFAFGSPAKPQSVSDRLLRDPDVNWLSVHADDVELRLSRRRET